MSKLLTGAKATITIAGRPLIYATDVAYTLGHTCSCHNLHYPIIPPHKDPTQPLFNLLHKLLHKGLYA